MRGRLTVWAILLAASLAAAAPARATIPVDLELVLAVDVSGSMDFDELELQREGYVEALASREVAEAIAWGAYGRIALAYLEWAGPGNQRLTVPWRAIEDAAGLRAFAGEVAGAPTIRMRGTSISAALETSLRLFEDNGFQGLRRVIDISGDGPNNMGAPVLPIRDRVLQRGITINGLPITLKHQMASGVDLDIYYEDCVIGGPGAFLMAVHEREQLATAIRQKLVLEIAGLAAAVVPAQYAPRPEPRVDCTIGERMRRYWESGP
jgi:hypothetical protein